MQPRPDWLKSIAPQGEEYEEMARLVESARLNTVCQSANCPNIGECWRAGTATFMILGDTCTRNCRFCAVGRGEPRPVDDGEPERVAVAVAELHLKHAVITSVTRDDLPDGGASVFAQTISRIRALAAGCTIEVLIPDFKGHEAPLRTVLASRPDVLNHNIETVKRLYDLVRPEAVYWRSIELLQRAKHILPGVGTKSGIMIGLGETWDEIIGTMGDLRDVDVDILTIGQYLSPSKSHASIEKYYTPQQFSELESVGLDMGFGYVESGPLVRSSYKAGVES